MELYILNNRYEQVGYIDQAESILWNKKYNDAGECEIYIPCDEYMLSLLKEDYYVYRYDDDMFCKIQTVEIENDVEKGDYIIATANDICKILSGRIIRWRYAYSGTVFNFIKTVLNDNVINPQVDGALHKVRQIPNFRFDSSNEYEFVNDTIQINAFTEDLLQLIIDTCKTYNYGFRISYDNGLVFKLYKGIDRSVLTERYVEFSPAYSNIISSKYKETNTNYKNVVYVGYKNDADEIELLSMYAGQNEGLPEPQGENRREIYVDGTSVSKEITREELDNVLSDYTVVEEGLYLYIKDDYDNYITQNGVKVVVGKYTDVNKEKIEVSNFAYMLLIRILGENTLAEYTKTQEFTGEIDTISGYVYKQDYNLGDIVKVKNEYGIEAEARIISILESEDDNDGHVVEPTFEYIYKEKNQNTISNALLTENNLMLLAENNEPLVVEEISVFALPRADETVDSNGVKISELPVSDTIFGGCCIPIVSEGMTKKIYYKSLEEKLLSQVEDDEAITNDEIDEIMKN